MRIFESVLVLSVYLMGLALNMQAPAQIVQVTHTHAIDESHQKASHEHDHEHGHHHDHHTDQDTTNNVADSGKAGEQSVPHSHCVAIAGTATYVVPAFSIGIFALDLSAESKFAPTEDTIYEDAFIGSIFRPPIA